MQYEGHSLFLIFWVGCPFLVWFITIYRERAAFRLLCSPLLTPHIPDKYVISSFRARRQSYLILSFHPCCMELETATIIFFLFIPSSMIFWVSKGCDRH